MDDLAVPRLPLPSAYADPAFLQCLRGAIETPELVENFDRLYGANLLSGKRSPIERMVDKATGKQDDDFKAFAKFVYDSIYLRLPDEAIEAFRLASVLQPAQA